MLKVFISYKNDVTDLTTVLDFHIIILNLKLPMMDNLSFIHNIKHFSVVDTIMMKLAKIKHFLMK